jgi:hypothetical protein
MLADWDYRMLPLAGLAEEQLRELGADGWEVVSTGGDKAVMRRLGLRARAEALCRLRLEQIETGRPPVLLPEGARLVLHVVPAHAGTPLGMAATLRVEDGGSVRTLLSTSGGTRRHNADGYLVCRDGYRGGQSLGYVQFFRSGVIEAVDATVVQERQEGARVSPGEALERGARARGAAVPPVPSPTCRGDCRTYVCQASRWSSLRATR